MYISGPLNLRIKGGWTISGFILSLPNRNVSVKCLWIYLHTPLSPPHSPDVTIMWQLDRIIEWNLKYPSTTLKLQAVVCSFVSLSWGKMDSLSKGPKTTAKLIHRWGTQTLFVCLTSAVSEVKHTAFHHGGKYRWACVHIFSITQTSRLRVWEQFRQTYTYNVHPHVEEMHL